jgi:hypothetical protein
MIDDSSLCINPNGIINESTVSININGLNRINNSSLSRNSDDLIKENIDTSHIERNEAGIQNRRPSLSFRRVDINADINMAMIAPSKLDSTLCS